MGKSIEATKSIVELFDKVRSIVPGTKRVRTKTRAVFADRAINLSDRQKALFVGMPVVIDAVLNTGVGDLTQSQIDNLVVAKAMLDEAVDIIGGRMEGIRDRVFEAITERTGDSDSPGKLDSPEHKKSLCREIRRSSDTLDSAALMQALVGDGREAVWNNITKEVTTRILDDDLVVDAFSRGDLSLEDLKAAFVAGKTTPVFVVRDIKEES